MADEAFKAARLALDRGDYSTALRLLQPLAESLGVATAEGAEVRLCMATALMGLGDSGAAADCCRGLQRCPDAGLRAQARELLLVLEAPALQRPREWSLTLPDLAGGRPLEQLRGSGPRGRGSSKPPPPPPPPVGPTRAPLGFAAISLLLVLLVLLAAALGGCMEVRSAVHFDGPGRLQVSHQLRHDSGTITPWQRRLASRLQGAGFTASTGAEGLRLSTPVLPAGQALEAFVDSLSQASLLAGHPLPPPRLEWSERNWWLGVSQTLELQLDLAGLADLPGLDLSLQLDPVAPRAVRRAQPLPARARGRALVWPLALGQTNTLRLRCWRWSVVGLGSLLIALALGVSLVLQRIRLRLGYGPPQLPA
ncbi:MAG: DUF3153 domain-containing protein [Synechococcaceae cyanobacterium]|nr:DUF3153 domain-containing protein [Synechococcaceae cyanobacterium]